MTEKSKPIISPGVGACIDEVSFKDGSYISDSTFTVDNPIKKEELLDLIESVKDWDFSSVKPAVDDPADLNVGTIGDTIHLHPEEIDQYITDFDFRTEGLFLKQQNILIEWEKFVQMYQWFCQHVLGEQPVSDNIQAIKKEKLKNKNKFESIINELKELDDNVTE